jgi:hypothetical protein
MVSESWWPSSYEFESHHPHLFDKKNKHNIMWVCASFKSKEFSLEGGILNNNINYILKPHLIA